jgi:hypothetical protein
MLNMQASARMQVFIKGKTHLLLVMYEACGAPDWLNTELTKAKKMAIAKNDRTELPLAI